MSRIVFGTNPVIEALKAHPERVSRVCYSGDKLGVIKSLLIEGKRAGVNFTEEEIRTLDKLTNGAKHQGLVAILSEYIYSDLDKIIANWKTSGKKAFIVILDGIQDPQNLGAIIRSAEAAGVHGIIIPKDRAAGITSTVEQVSAGAVEHIMVARETNLVRTVDRLKDEGIWVAGAEAGGKESIYDADLDMDIALVIGSEGKGIRSLLLKSCDFILSIPMAGRINSLNASVSAALFIYEVVRQRKKLN